MRYCRGVNTLHILMSCVGKSGFCDNDWSSQRRENKMCVNMCFSALRHTMMSGCVFLLLKHEIHSVSFFLPNCQTTLSHSYTHSRFSLNCTCSHKLKIWDTVSVHTHTDYCGQRVHIKSISGNIIFLINDYSSHILYQSRDEALLQIQSAIICIIWDCQLFPVPLERRKYSRFNWQDTEWAKKNLLPIANPEQLVKRKAPLPT